MKYGSERGSTGSPTHDPPAVSCHKPRKTGETLPQSGYEGRCSCSARMRRGSADSDYESEPDGNHRCPFRESKGARASEATLAGDARSRSERTSPFIRHTPFRFAGRKRLQTSERNNRAMTGADLLDDASRRPTVWRRRRCWNLSEFKNQLSRAIPKTRRSFDTPRRTRIPEREN